MAASKRLSRACRPGKAEFSEHEVHANFDFLWDFEELSTLASENPQMALELLYVADLDVGAQYGAYRTICSTISVTKRRNHPLFSEVMRRVMKF